MLRGERVQSCAHVSEDFHAHANSEGDGAEGIPEFETVVAFARVVELREARCVGTPVEFPTIDYYSSDCGAMATYPLGCAVDHYIGTVVNWTAEIAACAEGVVDYDRDTVFVCDFCNGFEVWDVVAGVSDGFNIYSLGFIINEGVKVGRGVSFDEFGGYAKARKGNFELVVGAAV